MDATNTETAPNSGAKPKKPILKWVLIFFIGLFVLLFAWHLSFKAGGSGQWEVAIDENGVKIETLKTPGVGLMKVKVNTRVKAQLSGIVKLIVDPASCDEGDCYESKLIERVDTAEGFTSFNTFRFDFPPPLNTREYVLKVAVTQDKSTKDLAIAITAAPDHIPPNDCCVRVPYMNNKWQIKPVGNGELDVELIMDADAGGNMPYVLANLGAIYGMQEFFLGLQQTLDKDKFTNVELDYVVN